jgi:hypothetical protein
VLPLFNSSSRNTETLLRNFQQNNVLKSIENFDSINQIFPEIKATSAAIEEAPDTNCAFSPQDYLERELNSTSTIPPKENATRTSPHKRQVDQLKLRMMAQHLVWKNHPKQVA